MCLGSLCNVAFQGVKHLLHEKAKFDSYSERWLPILTSKNRPQTVEVMCLPCQWNWVDEENFSFCRVRFTCVALGCLSLLFSDLNVIWHRLEDSSQHTLLSLWLSLGQGAGICIPKLPGEAKTNSLIRHSRHSAVCISILVAQENGVLLISLR